MRIPYIPVCPFCLSDLETFEKDESGNVISWICPECGEIWSDFEVNHYKEN